MKLARPLIESFQQAEIRLGTAAGLAAGLSREYGWTQL